MTLETLEGAYETTEKHLPGLLDALSKLNSHTAARARRATPDP